MLIARPIVDLRACEAYVAQTWSRWQGGVARPQWADHWLSATGPLTLPEEQAALTLRLRLRSGGCALLRRLMLGDVGIDAPTLEAIEVLSRRTKAIVAAAEPALRRWSDSLERSPPAWFREMSDALDRFFGLGQGPPVTIYLLPSPPGLCCGNGDMFVEPGALTLSCSGMAPDRPEVFRLLLHEVAHCVHETQVLQPLIAQATSGDVGRRAHERFMACPLGPRFESGLPSYLAELIIHVLVPRGALLEQHNPGDAEGHWRDELRDSAAWLAGDDNFGRVYTAWLAQGCCRTLPLAIAYVQAGRSVDQAFVEAAIHAFEGAYRHWRAGPMRTFGGCVVASRRRRAYAADPMAFPSSAPATMPLHEMLGTLTGQLSDDDMRLIVEQATLVLDQLYSHLPLKRAMFAVDPLCRLRLLLRRIGEVSELSFHREMLSIFTELHDLHTVYQLPEPFRSKVAFVPLCVERMVEQEALRYVLSKVGAAVDDPHFRPGVLILHWNGVPIERAVELSAERHYGSNVAAGLARGLEALTIRPLRSTLWPDEHWVDIRYLAADGQVRELRFEWQVADGMPGWIAPEDPSDPESMAEGIDRVTEAARWTRKRLFAPEAVALDAEVAALRQAAGGSLPGHALARHDETLRTSLPDNFSFRPLETAHGTYGYVRLWSFENTTGGPGRMPVRRFVEAFVEELMRILAWLPQGGLILDVRGNPGGRIPAGERILELLTPHPIAPTPLHFRSTPLTHELCRLAPEAIELKHWEGAVDVGLQTGATYSRGIPFVPFSRDYNRIGQRYHGPVVLIVDALCYSTTDIFAASFQDHRVGPVLGTDACTGAGGANAWPHELLVHALKDSKLCALRPLPGGASFSVALRHATRVGERQGALLENLGVVPDLLHHPTRDDIFHGNRDLLARAAEVLAGLPARRLGVSLPEYSKERTRLSVTTRNIPRLDVYVGGRPRRSLDVQDGHTDIDLPPGSRHVELRGYEDDELVARRLLDVETLIPA